MDALPVGVLVCDRSGQIRHQNARTVEWFNGAGSLDDAFVRARFLNPIESWPTELARILGSEAGRSFECVVPGNAVSQPRLLRLRGVAWNSAFGEDEPGVILWIEQVVEQAEPDDRLGVTQRLASLGKLAARVAHELNNPLDGILRYVNLALRIANEQGEPKLRSYLSESRTGLMRMMQILGELLDYSRQTACVADDSDEASVNEVIDEALRNHAAAAEVARVVVTSDFRCPRMPRTRDRRLYQILGNLIRNALDAMTAGGRLTVTSTIVDDHAVVEVADTGIGLPLNLEEVFEPFYTTKPPGKGTGLGLAISRDYVRELNGTISAAHGADGGAVFTVRIPVASFENVKPPTSLPPGPSAPRE